MSELQSRMLNRKEVKAIKKQSGIDLHKLMLDVISSAKGDDIESMDIMRQMEPEVVDAILDHTFPNNESKLDEMSYLELANLTVEILGKTFGGEVEKKS